MGRSLITAVMVVLLLAIVLLAPVRVRADTDKSAADLREADKERAHAKERAGAFKIPMDQRMEVLQFEMNKKSACALGIPMDVVSKYAVPPVPPAPPAPPIKHRNTSGDDDGVSFFLYRVILILLVSVLVIFSTRSNVSTEETMKKKIWLVKRACGDEPEVLGTFYAECAARRFARKYFKRNGCRCGLCNISGVCDIVVSRYEWTG